LATAKVSSMTTWAAKNCQQINSYN
jgi:hypothetical protein